MLKKLNVLIFCFLLVIPGLANARDELQKYFSNPKVVGTGTLVFIFWDVYDATLYAPEGQWDEEKPYALEIKYFSDFTASQIIERTLEEMENIGVSDQKKLSKWKKEMQKVFPDVEEDHTLTGVLTEDGKTIFLKDSEEIGTIEDQEFGPAFFNIWLSEETSEPFLRRKLLGK